MNQFVSLDLPPVLCALFACLSCALLGNFLVLRRLSLMGDAISHAVLPGIVAAFLISGTRGSLAIFLGAAAAGILTAVAVELVRSFGKLETGASMGVVFSIMFAAGVLLMEQAAARNVDLDADCLLHGQLETIFWYPPLDFTSFFSLETLKLVPNEVVTSFVVFVVSVLFVILFFKELSLAAFDPALSTALGFSSSAMHYVLMVVVAGAVVASFEAIGSILVIAMIICPAATARFYTDRLRVQIFLSLIFTIIAVIAGYIIAGFAPGWLGYGNSVNAGGMMTVVSGILLFSSALFAPEYGIVSRKLRRSGLSLKVCREDVLAQLYRQEEVSKSAIGLSLEQLSAVSGSSILCKKAVSELLKNDWIVQKSGLFQLTEKGTAEAQSIIRSHRLWESFLVEQAGLQPDHVHSSAEKLEHFTPSELTARLAEEQAHSIKDPHGKTIP